MCNENICKQNMTNKLQSDCSANFSLKFSTGISNRNALLWIQSWISYEAGRFLHTYSQKCIILIYIFLKWLLQHVTMDRFAHGISLCPHLSLCLHLYNYKKLVKCPHFKNPGVYSLFSGNARLCKNCCNVVYFNEYFNEYFNNWKYYQ